MLVLEHFAEKLLEAFATMQETNRSGTLITPPSEVTYVDGVQDGLEVAAQVVVIALKRFTAAENGASAEEQRQIV